MCLGEVVRLVEVGTDGAALAQLGSRTVPVSLLTLDEQVVAGDWVVMHSGFALSRLTDDEASEALALRSTPPGSRSTPPAPPGGRQQHQLEREGPT